MLKEREGKGKVGQDCLTHFSRDYSDNDVSGKLAEETNSTHTFTLCRPHTAKRELINLGGMLAQKAPSC